MVINAAGGGYERTLGMYRVSRALHAGAAQRARFSNFLLNIPPAEQGRSDRDFPLRQLATGIPAPVRGTGGRNARHRRSAC